jgi:hypothetical protein
VLRSAPSPSLQLITPTDTYVATAVLVAVAACRLLLRLRMAGTSYDIVILSSSPPAHDLYAPSSPLNGSPISSPRRVAMPASPLLAHSPPVSAQKQASGASVHGSRKADIPPDAIRGFATVGSLVRSEHFAQQFDDDTAGKDQVQSRRGSIEALDDFTATKKTRKRSATAPGEDGDATPKPKPRARRPKAANVGTTTLDPELRLPAPKISPFFATEDAQGLVEPPKGQSEDVPKLTKSGKPRKPRAKKEKVAGEDVLPKPKKPRATKLKSNTKGSGEVQRDDACIESAHFRTDVTMDAPAIAESMNTNIKLSNTEDASIWEVPKSPQPKKKRLPKQRRKETVENLDLDEAVSRRRDWTPPRDTAAASPFADSVGKENKAIDSDAANEGFTHLISNFAYAQGLPAQVAATVAASTTSAMAVTKRRRVEVSTETGNIITLC